MPRMRISTTVDGELLAGARSLLAEQPDSAVMDEALRALLASHRAAEVDAAYARYAAQPLSTPDEWGDLESFRAAAGAT